MGISYYGPYFTGDGLDELSAFNEPFNGYEKGKSFTNNQGYRIPF